MEKTTASPPRPLRAARAGVALVFAVNGAVFANWVPRIPDVRNDLGIGEATLGLALAGLGVGSALGSLAAAPLVARWGSRRVTWTMSLLLCAGLPLLAVAPSWPLLGVALALLGFNDAATDVAMNANGVEVERRFGRPILTGFHAMWSLGALVGSATGALAAGIGMPVLAHFLAVAAVLAGLTGIAARRLLVHREQRREGTGGWRGATRGVWALGALGILMAVSEGATADWSAVYLRDVLGMSAGAAGGGFTAFATAMLLGRLVGDRVLARAGPLVVSRGSALVAAAGFTAVVTTSSPWIAVAGFGLVGLGVCVAFPVLFSTAGALPGLRPATGIAIVSLLGRLGFLLGPVLIGAVADVAGLRSGIGVALVAAATIAAVVGRTPVRRTRAT